MARVVDTMEGTVNHRLNRVGVQRQQKGLAQARRDDAVRA
jgi:hypothetical protein